MWLKLKIISVYFLISFNTLAQNNKSIELKIIEDEIKAKQGELVKINCLIKNKSNKKIKIYGISEANYIDNTSLPDRYKIPKVISSKSHSFEPLSETIEETKSNYPLMKDIIFVSPIKRVRSKKAPVLLLKPNSSQIFQIRLYISSYVYTLNQSEKYKLYITYRLLEDMKSKNKNVFIGNLISNKVDLVVE